MTHDFWAVAAACNDVAMRLPTLPAPPAGAYPLPLWPPLLATRGRGGRSELHAHHAMHFVLATSGRLRTRTVDTQGWSEAAGVLTAPDVVHAIDATGVDVLLVFLDPESEVGAALAATVGGSLRAISSAERDVLVEGADPRAILREGGAAWTRQALRTLGGAALVAKRPVHPRVRKLLAVLRASDGAQDTSLEGLAAAVGLSPGRLMHVFTESIGVPLRPYLAWLKLQRAAGAIVGGAPLTDAAQAADFADAAHMSRTFRHMLGISPSALAPRHRTAD
jgi:AraC-like DNA-binding protein